MTTPATTTATNPAMIPSRFWPAYDAVAGLARHPRYLGAAIFGSVASGTATDDSDLDVLVLVDAEEPCADVNHPVIGEVKLDISFNSLAQLRRRTDEGLASGTRPPWLAGARVVFDKAGDLAALVTESNVARPKALTEAELRFNQFMFYHGDNKVQRHLHHDPAAASLVMHITINDVLKMHYAQQRHWWVSSKYLLTDLATWDAPLAALVRRFVVAAAVGEKFAFWTAILDHILAPLGGRQPIAENNCPCPACTADLAALLAP